ncbi:hypothetical protein [Streptomyces sp. MMG1121]|uniref:hypothetical protein n=1 Tax=Streptomyces sp. MMG1121 TaxID=1415544 RepID=UPI000B2C07B4|nr:hypothetical protein [Streptomyces sp. MMG1121]
MRRTGQRHKHREPGEYCDTPLPARIRETIEWCAAEYGTVEGHLLRRQTVPRKPYPQGGSTTIPVGVVLYGNRRFSASNGLGNGIPITDLSGA